LHPSSARTTFGMPDTYSDPYQAETALEQCSGFAVGIVSAIKDTCLNDPRQRRIRIIHQAEPDNPALAALRGWPRDNDDLLNLLVEEA
jgi:hypothetical protein